MNAYSMASTVPLALVPERACGSVPGGAAPPPAGRAGGRLEEVSALLESVREENSVLRQALEAGAACLQRLAWSASGDEVARRVAQEMREVVAGTGRLRSMAGLREVRPLLQALALLAADQPDRALAPGALRMLARDTLEGFFMIHPHAREVQSCG